MSIRILRIVLLTTPWLVFQANAQAQAAPGQGGTMQKPPPVSGQSYRTEGSLEERSNYISGGISAGGGYIDNIEPGSGTGQTGEGTFAIQPSISFDTTSARLHTSASYNPNFNFYQPSSELNETDQNAAFRFQYRFTPRLAISLDDTVVRSSNGFSQLGAGGISGSTQATTPGIIVPFGERFTNLANAELSYQFGPHGMIGGLGDVSNMDYGNSSQTIGLYNSQSHGGGGFYNYRLSRSQYLGAIYGYEQTLAYPTVGQYETHTHTIDAFYTIYLTDAFSLSVASGPQYYSASHAPSPTTDAWSPSIAASTGWQGQHSTFAAEFSRTVTGGGGLLGAFYTKTASALGTWQFARFWDAGLNVNYRIDKNATTLFALTSGGGHAFTTSLSLGRTLTPHTRASLRYDRIQNRYDGIQSIDSNPSSDRVIVSFSWTFHRPIGR